MGSRNAGVTVLHNRIRQAGQGNGEGQVFFATIFIACSILSEWLLLMKNILNTKKKHL